MLLFTPQLFKLPGDFGHNARLVNVDREAQLQLAVNQAQGNLEAKKLELQNQLAQGYEKAGLLAPHKALIIENYLLSTATRPPHITTSRYAPSDVVTLYDQQGLCIGRVQERQILWVKQHPETCLGAK